MQAKSKSVMGEGEIRGVDNRQEKHPWWSSIWEQTWIMGEGWNNGTVCGEGVPGWVNSEHRLWDKSLVQNITEGQCGWSNE